MPLFLEQTIWSNKHNLDPDLVVVMKFFLYIEKDNRCTHPTNPSLCMRMGTLSTLCGGIWVESSQLKSLTIEISFLFFFMDMHGKRIN